MTVEWTDIRFSIADQPYVLAAPSPAQRRCTVNGRVVGWVGQVARFISGAVERAAHAAYRRVCDEVNRRFEAAKKAARDLETSRFVRRHLASFGSPEGRLRRKPLKGPWRVLRGEVP